MKKILAIGIAAMLVLGVGSVVALNQEATNGNRFDIRPEKTTDLQGYDEAKDIIAQILDAAELQNFEGQVVGAVEHGDLKILLIDQGDKVLELAWDGINTWKFTLTPELLGSKEYPISINCCEEYNISGKKGVELYKLGIQIPSDFSGGPAVLYTHIVTVWRHDCWHVYDTENCLHTEGKFYIDYGNEVETILDNSYTDTGFGFDLCTFDHTTTGEGTCAGKVDTYALWALDSCPVTTKFSIDAWVSADCYLNTDDDAFFDKWMAIGCGCAAYP